jgi:hypothetical protein
VEGSVRSSQWSAKAIDMANQPHSYIQLKQQIHDALRIQHPEWIEPSGNCPTCDSYDSRFAELLSLSNRTNNAISNIAPLEALPEIA